MCFACLLQTIQECLFCKIFISSILFPSYEFHVKPRNPLGEGPSSNVVAFSTESGKNSNDQITIYSTFSTHVCGMHERLSHFILCIQISEFVQSLPPDWLFTTVPGKSTWDQNCVCEDIRWTDCKRKKQRNIVWYSLQRKLLHP